MDKKLLKIDSIKLLLVDEADWILSNDFRKEFDNIMSKFKCEL